MNLFNRTPLSPEEQARKDRMKALERQQRREQDARRAEAQKEEFDAMPNFLVREIREVTVKAKNMPDAIALASAAFKEGQSDDHTIKWRKPFGIDGDTVDEIRVVDIQASKRGSSYPAPDAHSRACGPYAHEHGYMCHDNCPTCGGK